MARPRAWAVRLAVMAALLLGTSLSTLPGQALEPSQRGAGADRLIFWVNCEEIAALRKGELGRWLDAWKERGVDGFVCQTGHMVGMGGTQKFTGDPKASLRGRHHSLQRRLRDLDVGDRAAARGMKLYLGTYLANYFNTSTPLVDWFDDTGWKRLALPAVRRLAGAARILGFAGVALDQELYTQEGGARTATWNWDHPRNTWPEARVRAQARHRGRELMGAILSAFPGVELAAYDVQFPDSWHELVQKVVNGIPNAFAPRLDIDFWDGISSVRGYSAIRLFDATFYKTPHLGTWETAHQYNANRLHAYLSRTLSGWEYASSRLFVSPFAWIDAGPGTSAFDDARHPAYVRKQLVASRKWGTGGEFANYAYAALDDFDYSPYVEAMQAASEPRMVDRTAPTLRITTDGVGPSASIEGTAVDNLAIHAVRWQDDRGGSGMAELRWEVLSGDYRSGYEWRMRWSVSRADLALGATRVTITAEDIKGNVSSPTTLFLG